MQALVRQETLSDLGREQMKVLADLEVTAKSVERTGGRDRRRDRVARAREDPPSPALGTTRRYR